MRTYGIYAKRLKHAFQIFQTSITKRDVTRDLHINIQIPNKNHSKPQRSKRLRNRKKLHSGKYTKPRQSGDIPNMADN